MVSSIVILIDFFLRDEWKKQTQRLQSNLEKVQKKARRKERQLHHILAAAEAEREYLRSLYNGSLIAISNSAMRPRDGAGGREYDTMAAEARCVGMEEEIRRLRAENEALRMHVAAVSPASLTPHGFQIHSGPPGYAGGGELVLVPQDGGARRRDGGDAARALQLTGDGDGAPFSCSTSPIPREPGWSRSEPVRRERERERE
jgi:hypothetical protein